MLNGSLTVKLLLPKTDKIYVYGTQLKTPIKLKSTTLKVTLKALKDLKVKLKSLLTKLIIKLLTY